MELSHQLRQMEAGELIYKPHNRAIALPPCVMFAERGFSLVSAIFLLVVIAALGTFAVTLSTTQQQGAALDIMGSRAYQAARTGVEWGAYQVVPGSAAAYASTCRTSGSNSQTISPLSGTLESFTVTVNCVATSHTEATSTVWGYQLAASATQGTQYTLGYVERNVASDVWIVE
jgi:MSHA biogenesis protein MshP